MAEATPQMGDWAPGSYESNRFTIGDEPSQQQQQWTADLGEVPKDCYYCKGSGDCPQDGPEKGKDYMGQKCNSCSGSGKCSLRRRRCDRLSPVSQFSGPLVRL